jgi:hypothetical protein
MIPQIELWNDTDIIQDNSRVEGKGRVYRHKDKEYSSVTTIIGKFEDKAFLSGWQKRVGKAKAEAIKVKAGNHGTNAHAALENHFRYHYPELILAERPELQLLPLEEQELAITSIKESLRLDDAQLNLIEPFQPLFPYIHPISLEKRIFWHDEEDPRLGYGGTVDAYKYIDCSLLPTEVKPYILDEGRGYSMTVLDWKNFNKRKAPISKKKNGELYFPLIKYALQLSAYVAPFNKLTKEKYTLNQGMLACAYNISEDGEPMVYKLDLYYFDQRSICWFWKEFKKILHAYYYNEEYSWGSLCKRAYHAGVLGERIDLG